MTYPLHNRVHRQLISDIKAQKHSIPGNIRQPLDSVEVRRAGGVLHLDAGGLEVVHAIVDVGFVQGAGERRGLNHYQHLPPHESPLNSHLENIHIWHGFTCQLDMRDKYEGDSQ